MKIDQLPFNAKWEFPEYILKMEIKPTTTSRTLTFNNEHWMLRRKITSNTCKDKHVPCSKAHWTCYKGYIVST